MAFEPLPVVSGEQYKYEPLVIEHYGPPIPTFDELETKGSVPTCTGVALNVYFLRCF